MCQPATLVAGKVSRDNVSPEGTTDALALATCRRSAAIGKSCAVFHRTKVRCYRMPPLRGY